MPLVLCPGGQSGHGQLHLVLAASIEIADEPGSREVARKTEAAHRDVVAVRRGEGGLRVRLRVERLLRRFERADGAALAHALEAVHRSETRSGGQVDAREEVGLAHFVHFVNTIDVRHVALLAPGLELRRRGKVRALGDPLATIAAVFEALAGRLARRFFDLGLEGRRVPARLLEGLLRHGLARRDGGCARLVVVAHFLLHARFHSFNKHHTTESTARQ